MIKELIGAVLIFLGVFVMVLAVAGTFRFKYVLNRMHAASMGDTLGILLILSGLMVLAGFSPLFLKILSIIIFMWMASPVMSYLVSRAEVLTYSHLEDQCEVIKHDDSI